MPHSNRSLHPSSPFRLHFTADDQDLWEDFLKRIDKSKGFISYYPSAGADFRPIFYQQIPVLTDLGLTNMSGEILKPTPELLARDQYPAPDLWIYSDGREGHLSRWLTTNVIYTDERVEIRVISHTELHPTASGHGRRLAPPQPSETTGNSFYLNLETLDLSSGRRQECDLIYFRKANLEVIQRFLLPSEIQLSHLVWLKDELAIEKGTLRHSFLIPLTTLFKTRWLFLDDNYLDQAIQIHWPSEMRQTQRLLGGASPDLRRLGAFQSNADRVAFCEVDRRRAELVLELARERQRSTPGFYLWLCSEGWMSFGPFEWLHYDESSSSLIDPTGSTVAWFEAERWNVTSGKGARMIFDQRFMITATAEHPHPDCGHAPQVVFPRRGQLQARSARSGTQEVEVNKTSHESWQSYFEADFVSSLKTVLERLKSKSDCNHCRAPRELRVDFQRKRNLVEIVPQSQLDHFLSCWHLILWISQGLHRHFAASHPKWQDAVFCPLPVHPVGMGCVQVSPARALIKDVQLAPAEWISFTNFFNTRVLAQMERLTTVKPDDLISRIQQDRISRREPLSWHESKLLRAYRNIS